MILDTRTVTSDESSEKKSISFNKSRITQSLSENLSPQMDLAIEQLEKDHYLYRRGSTRVHVQLSITFNRGWNYRMVIDKNRWRYFLIFFYRISI